ncbi:hypothetical protein JB92DRAFT_2836849 [Gautieria morchelliformis]|nr:hypothetical protein JB92DRAFT_2836849 [Gautieria morchelliformis]
MATCFGKAYSEHPASAEANTLNPYTELPQEPGHKETSMDLGDKSSSPLPQAEGMAFDVFHSIDARTPPLEVEARTPIDTLIAEDRHKAKTCCPCPADGADSIDCPPAPRMEQTRQTVTPAQWME